jgi:hypothetical protein
MAAVHTFEVGTTSVPVYHCGILKVLMIIDSVKILNFIKVTYVMITHEPL